MLVDAAETRLQLIRLDKARKTTRAIDRIAMSLA